ncbi:MAG: hypothetical protein JSU73_14330 [candidate division WOR-3 bacterium]|nr:MAG: hypothetical protein JSU73_14330 [candidate division WOR-3 bacterium]
MLLVDGLWFSFNRKPWVVYNMALKPVGLGVAFFLDPLMLCGKESAVGWREAIASMPLEPRKRIRGLVSDGFRGSKNVARENGWVHQLCRFHLQGKLRGFTGCVQSTVPDRHVRRLAFELVCEVIKIPDEKLCTLLATALQNCLVQLTRSRAVCGIVRQLLRDLQLYRSYLLHPELELPTTTNAVESMHSLLRKVASCVNNPQALLVRARSLLRLHPVMTCNPNYLQK